MEHKKASIEGRFRGVNYWVSTLSLSGDEARVFDVLYRKSHKTPFCIYSRRFFWLHFGQEFAGVSYLTFTKYLRKYQALCILILEKKEDGIYMRSFAQPYAQQQELALDIEPGEMQKICEHTQKVSQGTQKICGRTQKICEQTSPHTPLYKEEKNRKEIKGGGEKEEALQPSAASASKVSFVPVEELTWEDVVPYAQLRKIDPAVAQDWFAKRAAVGWRMQKGQPIVNWQADLSIWWKRERKEPKRPHPKSQGGARNDAESQKITQKGLLSSGIINPLHPLCKNVGRPPTLDEEPIKVLSDKERAEAQVAMQQTLENIKRLEQQMQDPGGRKKAERQRKAELLHATPRAATPCPSWGKGAEGELGAARQLGAMCKGQPEDVVLNMLKQKYPAREDEVLRQEFLRAYRGI